MQATLKLLGLALLEILAGPFFFMASSFALSMFGVSFQDNFLAYLAMTAAPIILLGGLLAHFWGLWRANWVVRVATAATCFLIPVVVSLPAWGILALIYK
jgi:hypothetical protein